MNVATERWAFLIRGGSSVHISRPLDLLLARSSWLHESAQASTPHRTRSHATAVSFRSVVWATERVAK
jgi:hypothetical protein